MKLADHELDELLDKAGLRIAQPYSPKQSYRKDDYMLTACKDCGVETHYKLKYILDKNSIGERVCRACYWRQWYGSARDLYEEGVKQLIDSGMTREELIKQGVIFSKHDASWNEARSLCEQNGYELKDLIRGDRPGEDVLITQCPNCGRILPQRPSDVTFRCPCGGVKSKGGICYSKMANPVQREDTPHIGEAYQTGESRSLPESSSDCLDWWDAEKNEFVKPETLTQKSKQEVWWKCPTCGTSFSATVYEMASRPVCPACKEKRHADFERAWNELKQMSVAEIPELLEAWRDERDPYRTPMTYNYTCKFKCPEGHYPNQTSSSFLMDGCMVCRGLKTRSDPNRPYLIDTNPELAAEWYQAEDGDKYTPENVRSGSKRTVIWECMACGGRWSDTVREREKREKNRCPHCGKIMGSLAWKYPTLAEEWHPDNPVSPWNTKPFGKLDFKPRWICRNNPSHIWEATTSSRINNGKDCPICEREAKNH